MAGCSDVVWAPSSGAPLSGRNTRMLASDWLAWGIHQGTIRGGMHARAYYKGHVGRSHRGRLRTEDGPRGSSYTTKPLSFIRWISCGRIDATCSPSTCINSAIDTRTRRRNSDTISSCVGSDMGRVPLEAAWIATFVIGVPIIHGFERQEEKIHAISRGMRKDTTSPRCGDRLTFKYATFYHDDVHHRSPPVSHRSGRDKGGLRSRKLCSIHHIGISRVTPRQGRL